MTAVAESSFSMLRESSIDTQHGDAVHPEEMDPQLVRTLELVITFPKDSFSVNAMGHLTNDKKEIKYTVWYKSDQIFCQQPFSLRRFFGSIFNPSSSIPTIEQQATSKKLNHSLKKYKTSITHCCLVMSKNNTLNYYENVIRISDIRKNIKGCEPLIIINADYCLTFKKAEYCYPALGVPLQYVKNERELVEPDLKITQLFNDITQKVPSAKILILSSTPNLRKKLEFVGIHINNDCVTIVEPCTLKDRLPEAAVWNQYTLERKVEFCLDRNIANMVPSSIHMICHEQETLWTAGKLCARRAPCHLYHYIRVIDQKYRDIAHYIHLEREKSKLKGYKQNMGLREYSWYDPNCVRFLAARQVLLADEKTITQNECATISSELSKTSSVAIKPNRGVPPSTANISEIKFSKSSSQLTESISPDDNSHDTQFYMEGKFSSPPKTNSEKNQDACDKVPTKEVVIKTQHNNTELVEKLSISPEQISKTTENANSQSHPPCPTQFEMEDIFRTPKESFQIEIPRRQSKATKIDLEPVPVSTRPANKINREQEIHEISNSTHEHLFSSPELNSWLSFTQYREQVSQRKCTTALSKKTKSTGKEVSSNEMELTKIIKHNKLPSLCPDPKILSNHNDKLSPSPNPQSYITQNQDMYNK